MQKIAVFYLARTTESSCKFRKFAESYLKHPAGEEHDFYLICKGGLKPGIKIAIEDIFSGINYKIIEMNDDGFDIQAYIRAAKQVPNEDVLFFNTHTEIQTDNWLRKMSYHYRKPGVGAVGTTSSYESIFTSIELLIKIIQLTRHPVRFNKRITKQYGSFLKHHGSSWYDIDRSIYRRLRKFLGDIKHRRVNYNNEKIKSEINKIWLKCINEGGDDQHAAYFPDFPNPHLRTNGFLVSKKWLEPYETMNMTKLACWIFESGVGGFSHSIMKAGLDLVVVGANGEGYSIEEWPKSRGFRLGDQDNLIISDNQVRDFFHQDKYDRDRMTRMTWGDYLNTSLNQHSNNKLIDFDLFSINDPKLLKRKSHYKISIVIPCYNRAHLIKDAIFTVMEQKNASDFELVIFDNASTIPLKESLNLSNDERIIFKRSEKFLPVTDSWNQAISFATGDYTILLGDDDGLAPDFFKKINFLIEQFHEPDFIYSAIYQFMHPGVNKDCYEGYFDEHRNGFFFSGAGEKVAFILDSNEAKKAWMGSLNLKRNFNLGMQSFIFKNSFLESLKINNCVFQSPYPDYYLANLAMARGKKILVCSYPLTIQGVSKASFGYCLFNGKADTEGKKILNTDITKDNLYNDYKKHFLPGSSFLSSYLDNYILTMGHVVKNASINVSKKPGIKRYRKFQIASFISTQNNLFWMKSNETGKLFWSKLNLVEKAWALWISFLYLKGKEKKIAEKTSPYEFVPIQKRISSGEFNNLQQIYLMLDKQEESVAK